MDAPLPHRCPKCNALVVDRRSPVCTTCRKPLPAEWVMTAKQVAQVNVINQAAQADYAASMTFLNPRNNPDLPPIVRLLDTDLGPY